jgi:hypothetical protein
MSDRLSSRFEIKFRISQDQAAIGKVLFRDIFKQDSRPEYMVQSIYFDSPEYDFYTEKIEGLLVRVKPRLRIYRSTVNYEPLGYFFEFKNRSDKHTHKERIEIAEDQALEIVSGKVPDSHSPVIKKLEYFLSAANLKPAVNILYKREAYSSPFFHNLRLTYDRLIQSSLSVNSLEFPVDAPYMVDPREVVVELKYDGSLAAIIMDHIKDLEWSQVTLSKYSTALEQQFIRVENYFRNI